MKIILSRKGFDKANGGVPSPIFPDGTALSLPIPYRRSPTAFNDVRWRDTSLGSTVKDLTKGGVTGRQRCHLDPDLYADALPRLPGWRPAFGQVENAQSHLQNQGVGPGDLFLFFGWFRSVERVYGIEVAVRPECSKRAQVVRLAAGFRGRTHRWEFNARPFGPSMAVQASAPEQPLGPQYRLHRT